MTRLRQTIARRLKDAQNTAAMLTTYNEVDMSGIMEIAQRIQGRCSRRSTASSSASCPSS
jgi:2-oxoglutarate dehydrogenase E2 component (dihydrolipoamide succinyltransferase)